jgi:hypothetical protein
MNVSQRVGDGGALLVSCLQFENALEDLGNNSQVAQFVVSANEVLIQV